MNAQQQKYQAAIKRFVIGYHLTITALCVALLIIVWPHPGLPVKILFCLLIVLHVAWWGILPYLSVYTIKKVAYWYIIFLPLLLLPLAIFVAERNDPTTSLWFFMIPIASMVVYSPRKVVGWAIYAFALILLANLPHLIFGKDLFESLSIPAHMVITDSNRSTFLLANQLTLYTFFGLLCYSLYYIHIIHTIRLESHSKMNAQPDIEAETPEVEEDENKYDELYKNIIAYTESEKGYLDSDFNISTLAFALNSNIAYISRAILKKRDMNFCTFVNTYRIEHAKQMLHQGSEKYTIRHLCFSSGFHNQTTFNKAFKACEGITPTEYIKKIEEKGKKARKRAP